MKILEAARPTPIKLVDVFSALSDPVRLKILLCLAHHGEKSCAGFQMSHISKSTLSHHVKILRETGLIQLRIDGRQHFYRICQSELDTQFPGLLASILQTEEKDLL